MSLERRSSLSGTEIKGDTSVYSSQLDEESRRTVGYLREGEVIPLGVRLARLAFTTMSVAEKLRGSVEEVKVLIHMLRV